MLAVEFIIIRLVVYLAIGVIYLNIFRFNGWLPAPVLREVDGKPTYLQAHDDFYDNLQCRTLILCWPMSLVFWSFPVAQIVWNGFWNLLSKRFI